MHCWHCEANYWLCRPATSHSAHRGKGPARETTERTTDLAALWVDGPNETAVKAWLMRLREPLSAPHRLVLEWTVAMISPLESLLLLFHRGTPRSSTPPNTPTNPT
ncbi:hypothetical protein CEP52_008130 [Fusarium oligoseptatum]|uniref:Uncharacterized protein n=1 Tax=Fusarium oligoseptatum TaxID=2604345 RepID=A0A428TJB9_9HYPO|nr:hypothetical protein CEP52_008130 [Fusarium oligoseptatum]